ncbi:hypothetical protein ACTXT7_001266 [Hymenolepis weldensis]
MTKHVESWPNVCNKLSPLDVFFVLATLQQGYLSKLPINLISLTVSQLKNCHQFVGALIFRHQ